MTARDPWLDRLDDLEHQLRRFVDDARAADRPEPVDALGDVLDRIRGELTEEVHASRRRVAGRALRGVHPTLRPLFGCGGEILPLGVLRLPLERGRSSAAAPLDYQPLKTHTG